MDIPPREGDGTDCPGALPEELESTGEWCVPATRWFPKGSRDEDRREDYETRTKIWVTEAFSAMLSDIPRAIADLRIRGINYTLGVFLGSIPLKPVIKRHRDKFAPELFSQLDSISSSAPVGEVARARARSLVETFRGQFRRDSRKKPHETAPGEDALVAAAEFCFCNILGTDRWGNPLLFRAAEIFDENITAAYAEGGNIDETRFEAILTATVDAMAGKLVYIARWIAQQVACERRENHERFFEIEKVVTLSAYQNEPHEEPDFGEEDDEHATDPEFLASGISRESRDGALELLDESFAWEQVERDLDGLTRRLTAQGEGNTFVEVSQGGGVNFGSEVEGLFGFVARQCFIHHHGEDFPCDLAGLEKIFREQAGQSIATIRTCLSTHFTSTAVYVSGFAKNPLTFANQTFYCVAELMKNRSFVPHLGVEAFKRFEIAFGGSGDLGTAIAAAVDYMKEFLTYVVMTETRFLTRCDEAPFVAEEIEVAESETESYLDGDVFGNIERVLEDPIIGLIEELYRDYGQRGRRPVAELEFREELRLLFRQVEAEIQKAGGEVSGGILVAHVDNHVFDSLHLSDDDGLDLFGDHSCYANKGDFRHDAYFLAARLIQRYEPLRTALVPMVRQAFNNGRARVRTDGSAFDLGFRNGLALAQAVAVRAFEMIFEQIKNRLIEKRMDFVGSRDGSVPAITTVHTHVATGRNGRENGTEHLVPALREPSEQVAAPADPPVSELRIPSFQALTEEEEAADADDDGVLQEFQALIRDEDVVVRNRRLRIGGAVGSIAVAAALAVALLLGKGGKEKPETVAGQDDVPAQVAGKTPGKDAGQSSDIGQSSDVPLEIAEQPAEAPPEAPAAPPTDPPDEVQDAIVALTCDAIYTIVGDPERLHRAIECSAGEHPVTMRETARSADPIAPSFVLEVPTGEGAFHLVKVECSTPSPKEVAAAVREAGMVKEALSCSFSEQPE